MTAENLKFMVQVWQTKCLSNQKKAFRETGQYLSGVLDAAL